MTAVNYYIVDLGKSFLFGRLVLQHRFRHHRGTCELARARRVPEDEVNAALGRYDNGSSTQALLCEAVDQLAFNGFTYAIPHRELLALCAREKAADPAPENTAENPQPQRIRA